MSLAGKLGVRAHVVKRSGQNGHKYRSGMGAIRCGIAEVMTLAGGKCANNQPDDEYDRSDSHDFYHLPVVNTAV
jgi:hypothetical protein